MYNPVKSQQYLYLADTTAGENAYNPLLAGLPFRIVAEFSESIHSVSGLVGSSSPPTTAFSLTQDSENLRRFTYAGIAGVSPFNIVDATTYIRILFTPGNGKQTVWEKKLYIASLPSNAIQVYSQENSWTSVNFGAMPGVIPLCAQMCPVRFCPNWYDEFRRPGYGGVRYTSVYDYGTNESDDARLEVKRDIDQAVAKTKYLYLEKHQVGVEEEHDIAIKLKTATGGAGVTVRVKVNSLSCWGFEIQDPVTI